MDNRIVKTIEEAVLYIMEEDIPYIAKQSGMGIKAVRNIILRKLTKCEAIIIEVANINKKLFLQEVIEIKERIANKNK